MKRAILIIVICLIQVIPSTAYSQDFWTQTNGPIGGIIKALEVNSTGVIFAGTDGGGIFRSSNQGASWEEINTGVEDHIISAIAVDSKDNVFIGSNVGSIFKSENNGDSWSEIENDFSCVSALLINGSDDIFMAGIGCGVYRSTDDGVSWQEINNGISNMLTWIIDINPSGHLFVGAYNGGVYRSMDNGDTWGEVNTGLTALQVQSLTVCDNGHLFVGTRYDGIFRSTDNGNGWEAVNSGIGDFNVKALLADDQNNILAGTLNGIYTSIDNGESWTLSCDGLGELRVSSLTCKNEIIYAGTHSGVYKSANSGESWDFVNAGLTLRGSIWSMAVGNNGAIYVGTCAGSIFKTTDKGESWENLSLGFNRQGGIYDISTGPEGYVYADFCGSGYIRSSNYGVDWEEMAEVEGAGRSVLYDNATETLFAGTTEKLYKSTNHGADWIETEIQVGIPYLTRIAYGAVWAGDYNGSIYKSIDNGETWDDIHVVDGGGKITEVIELAGGEIYVSIKDNGIYHSTDSGNSWEEISGDLPNLNVKSLFYTDQDDLYATTYGDGVFVYRDGWQPVNTGLTHSYPMASCRDAENYYYVGTDGGGVYKSTEKLTTVRENQNIPVSFMLDQNYPNPFNPTTTISYSIDKTQIVSLEIYNVCGRKIKSLINKIQNPGKYSISWSPIEVSSGIYFIKMSTRDQVAIKKAIFQK